MLMGGAVLYCAPHFKKPHRSPFPNGDDLYVRSTELRRRRDNKWDREGFPVGAGNDTAERDLLERVSLIVGVALRPTGVEAATNIARG